MSRILDYKQFNNTEKSDAEIFSNLGLKEKVCEEKANIVSQIFAPNTGFEGNHFAGLGLVGVGFALILATVFFRKR